LSTASLVPQRGQWQQELSRQPVGEILCAGATINRGVQRMPDSVEQAAACAVIQHGGDHTRMQSRRGWFLGIGQFGHAPLQGCQPWSLDYHDR
jgi:hypothetical protein